MTVRELLKIEEDYFNGIEIRDFKTNKRLAKFLNIKKAEKYLDCEVKKYGYHDSLKDCAYFEYLVLKIFI